MPPEAEDALLEAPLGGRTAAEIAATERDAKLRRDLAAGNDAVATSDAPKVTVQGDAEKGWHVEVHDGDRTTTHSPEAADADAATRVAIEAHAAHVDKLQAPATTDVAAMIAEAIGAIDIPAEADAAVKRLLPTIESHIEAKVGASLKATNDRLARLEEAAKPV